jgi:biopolymer transport protein ExbD
MAKKKMAVEEKLEDINLMPIMNLLCLLIPFLLLSAQFIQIGIVLVDTPRQSRSQSKPDENQKSLGLEVIIKQDGYDVKTKSGGSACPQRAASNQVCIPVTHAGGKKVYNAAALRKLLYDKFYKPHYKNNSLDKSKDAPKPAGAFSDWGKVTIVPEDTILYETVIQTLDAARELPPEAKNEIQDIKGGTLACVFKKKPGDKEWQLEGNCMFPLVAVGR